MDDRSTKTLIDVRHLKKYYPIYGGVLRRKVADVHALDDVSLSIRTGECLGLVGESGCGKTTFGKTLLRLHDPTSGEIFFDMPKADTTPSGAVDIAAIRGRRLADIRRQMQIVFQDPSNSLDPRMVVRDIVAEPLLARRDLSPRDREARVLEVLGEVGLGADHLHRYPHEFSGGQRQRIAIARAIATHPRFVLMDEPTSALDVSVQAQILNLLQALRRRLSLTYLFVTHHLLVAKYVTDRIAVMYLGRIVEVGDTARIFREPAHPYTKALLSAIAVPDPDAERRKITLSGDVPNPTNPPTGCRFHPRCPFAGEACAHTDPQLETVAAGHTVACLRWTELA